MVGRFRRRSTPDGDLAGRLPGDHLREARYWRMPPMRRERRPSPAGSIDGDAFSGRMRVEGCCERSNLGRASCSAPFVAIRAKAAISTVSGERPIIDPMLSAAPSCGPNPSEYAQIGQNERRPRSSSRRRIFHLRPKPTSEAGRAKASSPVQVEPRVVHPKKRSWPKPGDPPASQLRPTSRADPIQRSLDLRHSHGPLGRLLQNGSLHRQRTPPVLLDDLLNASTKPPPNLARQRRQPGHCRDRR